MININGNIFRGNNISITNNKVYIDGKQVQMEDNSKSITIKVHGDIDNLKVDSCDTVSVEGNVNSLNTTSGDVNITGEVMGSVSTVSGDVECSSIGGSASTISGDIDKNLMGGN